MSPGLRFSKNRLGTVLSQDVCLFRTIEVALTFSPPPRQLSRRPGEGAVHPRVAMKFDWEHPNKVWWTFF